MMKIVVAMSGGVDSSVAAALLKEEGHEVTGMMLRLWSEPGREESNRCCSPDAMVQARRAAAVLGIPFYAVDAQEIFHREIVTYFLEEYAGGKTPNPCLRCNRVIRWEVLLEQALEMGAEYMATGHYARTRMDAQGRIQLLRGVDPAKDQSYVLHQLRQEKLGRSLFPLGEYTKVQVRKLAKAFQLPTASRADSQDLCFLAGEDYRAFLRRNAVNQPQTGPIQTRDGERLGEHSGLPYYTIGQRKGLGLPSQVPLYVVGKDAGTNTLIVGTEEARGRRECRVSDINWISGKPVKTPFRAGIKTRYTSREVEGAVNPAGDGSRATIHFDTPVLDITPGQAAVFYSEEAVIGGGEIQD